MKETYNKYFGGGNAASKTNSRIALGIFFFLLVAGWLLWNDVSKKDFGKKKGTEQMLQSSKTQPDVANQNLLYEMQALSKKVDTLSEQKNNSQVNDEKLNEKIDRIIADRLTNLNDKGQTTVNPFETQNSIHGGQRTQPVEDITVGMEINGDSQESPGAKENIGNSASEKRSGLRRMKDEGAATSSKTNADDNKTYLPPGSILPYYLLTGINAPTNLTSESKNPPMALLNLKSNAILPNGFVADLSDCFVIGPVFGQYMDSRAVGRTKTISCIRDDGKAVEAKITGNIFGEDGKPGWHGRTASKTGKALAGLARVGFYQTIADIGAGAANGLNINLGGSSSHANGAARTQINLGTSAGQSVARNAGTAFEKMANIYEKYGNDAIPVIEVEAGRTGEIILTEGLTLEFSKEVQ